MNGYFRILVACYKLGINKRYRELYLRIHNLTEKGSKGEEIFNNEDNLNEFLSSDHIGACLNLADKVCDVDKNLDPAQDLRKMFSDQGYRKKHYKIYHDEILPIVKNTGFKGFFSILFTKKYTPK